MEIQTGTMGENEVVWFYIDGKPEAVNLVSRNGGGVIASGGGNVVSSGGGNLISSNMAGVSFGSGYRIATQGSKVIKTAGKTTLVIR